nr:hypothetical protein [Lysinibacillus timonensis]
MLIILVVLLIILQIVCFYVIALLNTKVAKFKDLESRQERVIREMEDSISLYLVEMKEENDRLIQELTKLNRSKGTSYSDNIAIRNSVVENTNKESSSEQVVVEKKIHVPKSIAQNAYNKYKTNSTNEENHSDLDNKANEVHLMNKTKEASLLKNLNDEQPLSFEQQVIQLHKTGKSVEEIAKMTNKGKTEIELLLKFNA